VSAYKMYFRTEKGLILRHGNVTFYRTGPLYPFSDQGDVQRISFAIYKSFDHVVTPYLYEEPLVGWPEQKVFWAAKHGPCVGIAPISPFSRNPYQDATGFVDGSRPKNKTTGIKKPLGWGWARNKKMAG